MLSIVKVLAPASSQFRVLIKFKFGLPFYVAGDRDGFCHPFCLFETKLCQADPYSPSISVALESAA